MSTRHSSFGGAFVAELKVPSREVDGLGRSHRCNRELSIW
jgi:hypothetical protein